MASKREKLQQHCEKSLDQLWATSLLPEHLKAGFRARGLFPLNAAAIPQYKVVPSIAVTRDVGVSTAVKEAPFCTELWHFFTKRLQPAQDVPKPKRKRVHVHAEGEALTNDDVMELFRNQEKEKKAKKKGNY